MRRGPTTILRSPISAALRLGPKQNLARIGREENTGIGSSSAISSSWNPASYVEEFDLARMVRIREFLLSLIDLAHLKIADSEKPVLGQGDSGNRTDWGCVNI